MSTFNYPNADNSATLNALLADLAVGIEPRACIGCGCIDANACIDAMTGAACYWVEPDLCSACYFEQNYSGPEPDSVPCVQLYTEADANREIADRRAIGGRL